MQHRDTKNRLTGLVTRKELAALLGISLPTLYNWIDAGLPAEQFPNEGDDGKRIGEWRFTVAEVVAWREHEIARLTKKHGFHYVKTVVLRTRIPRGGYP